MLYLIGGPVRVGKSGLARLVSQRLGVFSLTTDALTTMIGRVLPETRLAGGKIPQEEWENNFYPFLRKFLKTVQFDYEDFILEGAVISPTIVHKLSDKFDLQCIFVGNSEAELITLLEYMGPNIWLRNASPEELQLIPQNIIVRSKELEKASEECGYSYVDLAGDYGKHLEKAYKLLTG